MSTPPSPRPLARSALTWMLALIVRARLVIAPLFGSLAATFGFFEPTPWRRVLLACAVATLATLSLVEWARFRRHGLSVVQLPLNVLFTVLGQLLLIAATGGLFSPMLPALIPMMVITALFGERSTVLWLLLLFAPCLFAFALVHGHAWPVPSLLPALYGGSQAIERSPAPWIAASLYLALLAVSGRVGLALQRVLEDLFREATAERDRSLALHAEQARTLTLLTSEIAHELKNPLASIKGLSALVAKDVEGRAAERMAVMRGEVERMQSILEEFLTLSRPLVPLMLANTDLRVLSRDVLRLHEGSALDRGVRLELSGPDAVPLRCDPRKVRQVLINLLQNALDASPRGSVIKLRLDQDGERARVLVIDQGPGLSRERLARAFEPGVTDKEHGSGIGLVVARSLARQHGGEVDLHAGEAGGLIAALCLPSGLSQAEPAASQGASL